MCIRDRCYATRKQHQRLDYIYTIGRERFTNIRTNEQGTERRCCNQLTISTGMRSIKMTYLNLYTHMRNIHAYEPTKEKIT